MPKNSLSPSLSLSFCHVKMQRKAAIYKPGRGFSPGMESARTLISDFQPPEMWEINLCCLSPESVSLWYLLWQPKLTEIQLSVAHLFLCKCYTVHCCICASLWLHIRYFYEYRDKLRWWMRFSLLQRGSIYFSFLKAMCSKYLISPCSK